MYTLAMAAKKKRGSSEAGQGTTEASTVMASFRRLTGQAALVPFTFMVPLDAPCCCDFFPGGCVGRVVLLLDWGLGGWFSSRGVLRLDCPRDSAPTPLPYRSLPISVQLRWNLRFQLTVVVAKGVAGAGAGRSGGGSDVGG